MTSKTRDDKLTPEDPKVNKSSRKSSKASALVLSASRSPGDDKSLSASSQIRCSKKSGIVSVTDKIIALRRNFAKQMLIPDFPLGCSIDTHCDLRLYEDEKLVGEVIDIIPARSRCRVLRQVDNNKEVCAVTFANKWGYISIAGDKRLQISPSILAPTTVDKQKWPTKIDAATRETLDKCIWKYEIVPGCVMHILFLCALRKHPTAGADNPLLESIPSRTSVVVLALHEGRFARVRRLDPGAPAGWILAVYPNYLPVLGYFLPDSNVISSDTGARLKVLADTQAFERGKDGGYTPSAQFKIGSVVRVLGTSPPDEEGIQLKVVQDDNAEKVGYVDFYSEQGPNFAPVVGGLSDPRVGAFMHCAKTNNMAGIRHLTMPKEWMFGVLAPIIDDINVVDRTGKSAIFYALGFGNVDASRFLIRQKKFNPHVADNCKHTPLHYCCRRMPGTAVRDELGMCKVLGELLKLQADVNATDISGNTPLMFAARENNMLIALRLLQNGADASLKTVDNMSAKRIAAEMRFKPFYDLLNSGGPW
eukprot:GEMP01022850.1.p1 GENE.GEMP01022850.1~~GEMP01022850.1.p1  ORF type:complete len:534 (+),score=97.23 GEMP01022850.1:202-1803(+)